MSVPITLRPIGAGDEEFLYEVYAGTREQEMATLSWPESQKASFLRMQFNAQHASYQQHFPHADFCVIQSADRLVGRLYVNRADDEILVIDLALLPNDRRTGIGRKLLEAIFAEGEKTGKPVRAQVEWWNPAIDIFQKIGFRITGHDGSHYQIEWTPRPRGS